MIEFRDIVKTYLDRDGREHAALRGFDLEVRRGELHCLVGTSGCGKTTALRLVNRLETPTSGEVLVDGDRVASVDPYALRRRVGYVVQAGGLFPHLDVERNVGIMCGLEGQDPEAVRERVHDLLELVGLSLTRHGPRFPDELSGGQCQRVGVARALALDPEVLLMDEPFGALDPITRGQVHRQFEAMRARVDKTVVFVTHDLAEAFRLGDRVTIMHAGRVVQTGTEDELRHAPATEFVDRFLHGEIGEEDFA